MNTKIIIIILLVSSTVFASEPKKSQPKTVQEKYDTLQTVVPIPLSERETHPKIIVATTDNKICYLTASSNSSNNYTAQYNPHRNFTDDLNNSINYTITQYNCDNQSYNSMPYGKSSFKASAIKANTINEWKKEPTIAHQLATFPDGTLIITTKKGHVTAIAPDTKTSYINYDQFNQSNLITNGISALGCSTRNSNILAVGSNNGTITVFDISQKTIQDRKIHSIPFINSTPITSICFMPTDSIYFSTQHHIFFQPQDKNLPPKSIYKTTSCIKCITINNSAIACLINTGNNYDTSICLLNNNPFAWVVHDLGTTPIASLCLHKAKDQLYLITGNINGDVTIRSISNNNQLSEYITLKHTSPVNSVTITKDNRYLVITTTQSDENGNIIGNTIMHYPTPNDLDNQYSIYSFRLSDLKDEIVLNKNDGQKLYDILIKRHNFIHANTTDAQRIDCKDNMIQTIILFIKNIKTDELIINPILSVLRIIQQFSNSKKISHPEINTALSDKIISILLAAKKEHSTNNDILQEINKFVTGNSLIPVTKKSELYTSIKLPENTNLYSYKKTIINVIFLFLVNNHHFLNNI